MARDKLTSRSGICEWNTHWEVWSYIHMSAQPSLLSHKWGELLLCVEALVIKSLVIETLLLLFMFFPYWKHGKVPKLPTITWPTEQRYLSSLSWSEILQHFYHLYIQTYCCCPLVMHILMHISFNFKEMLSAHFSRKSASVGVAYISKTFQRT